jgi:hypothetical protein
MSRKSSRFGGCAAPLPVRSPSLERLEAFRTPDVFAICPICSASLRMPWRTRARTGHDQALRIRLPSCGRPLLAPAGRAVGCAAVGGAGRCGLSCYRFLWDDRDTSARVVRCADYRVSDDRPFGGRHHRHRERGLAVAAGVHYKGARAGRSRAQRGVLCALLEQLIARGVAGPIEVVPTLRRGEAAAVAPVVPIARGWSRQADIGRNPICVATAPS